MKRGIKRGQFLRKRQLRRADRPDQHDRVLRRHFHRLADSKMGRPRHGSGNPHGEAVSPLLDSERCSLSHRQSQRFRVASDVSTSIYIETWLSNFAFSIAMMTQTKTANALKSPRVTDIAGLALIAALRG